MLDEDFKDKMLTQMATQSAQLKNLSEWTEKIDTKLTVIQTTGCVIGNENEKRIIGLAQDFKEFRKNPERMGITGGLLAGTGSAGLFVTALKLAEHFLK